MSEKNADTKPFGKRRILLKRWVQHVMDMPDLKLWCWKALCENHHYVSGNYGFRTKKAARKAAELEYQGWELEFVEE